MHLTDDIAGEKRAQAIIAAIAAAKASLDQSLKEGSSEPARCPCGMKLQYQIIVTQSAERRPIGRSVTVKISCPMCGLRVSFQDKF